jgi:hypothetical protein
VRKQFLYGRIEDRFEEGNMSVRSRISKFVARRKARWTGLQSYQKWGVALFAQIAVVIGAIMYAMRALPEFIPNVTISAITPSYLLVGVTLLLLTTQIHLRDIRIWATGLSLLSIVLALFTMISSNLGSGFHILSTNVVTYDFAVSTLLLLLAIDFTAMGLLILRVQDISKKDFLPGDYWKNYIK